MFQHKMLFSRFLKDSTEGARFFLRFSYEQLVFQSFT